MASTKTAADFDFDPNVIPDGYSSNELDQIYHVTHTNTAIRIIEDGKIQTRIVSDESILKTSRTAVVWLSPKFWPDGSQYGNVQFEFDFSSFAVGRKLYWVEAIDYPSQTACRFLLTARDVSHLGLVEYDPATARGPVKFIDGKWRYNREMRVTLEVMLDEDIELRRSNKLRFISHHARLCAVNPSTCRDKGMAMNAASGKVLAKVLTLGGSILNKAYWEPAPANKPTDGLLYGVSDICTRLGVLTLGVSGPVSDDETVDILMKAALLQYAHNKTDDARKTVSLIASREIVGRRLRNLLCEQFHCQSSDLDEIFGAEEGAAA